MRKLLDRLEEVLIAFFMLGMTLLTFSQVIMRYGFNSGWMWSLEATTMMFGWLLMIGISYGMREHAHLNVDAFVNLLPRPWRRRLSLLAIACCFVYAGLMIWGAWGLEQRLFRLGTDARDLPVRRWMLMSILPIGFALLCYRLIQVAAEIVRGERDMLGSAHGAVPEMELAAPDAPAAEKKAPA
ncbi:MAG: TRAP transporter small permease [Rhodocyclales bacterium]|nr:TRAP transporter small permease [Rhodocyclales bacterium]